MQTLADEKPYIEFLAGRPLRKVSPKHRHAAIQAAVVSLLRMLGRGRGTWGTEWRFRIDDRKKSKTHLLPDVAFVSYERWRPLSPKQRQEPPFAPDLAIEIRSPDDREADVLWKMRTYLENGSLIALDVFPEERRIVAYAADGVREFREGEAFHHPSLPWLRFEVHEAFADLEQDE
jgi:Uma2 family endonuclease